MLTRPAAPARCSVWARMSRTVAAGSGGRSVNSIAFSWSSRDESRSRKPAIARIPRNSGRSALRSPQANKTARSGARSSPSFRTNCPALLLRSALSSPRTRRSGAWSVPVCRANRGCTCHVGRLDPEAELGGASLAAHVPGLRVWSRHGYLGSRDRVRVPSRDTIAIGRMTSAPKCCLAARL
jgi:hypothetical protein